MPDRPSVTQAVQMGVETTPGTAVAADILVRSFTIEPGVNVDMQRFRPTGSKFESIIVPGKEWTESSLSGLASYQELQYILSGIMAATGTQPAADGAAWKWSYELKPRTPDTIKTYSFEQGDTNFVHKFNYGLFTEVSLDLSRDGVELGGSMIARAITSGGSMTASPLTVDPEVPILPTEVDVYYDSTYAALGTTKLTRAFRAGITISDRFGPIWVLNSTSASFAGHVEMTPTVEVELLVEADAAGMALLTDMRAGNTGYLRIAATSAQLAAAGKPYKFQFDMAGKVADVSDYSDEDGVYAITWTMAAVLDADLGVKVALTNAQPTLAPG